MFQAHASKLGLNRRHSLLTPTLVLRPGQRAFWLVLVAELLVVLVAFALLFNALVPEGRVALADSDARQQVAAAVYSRLNKQTPDRMISIAPGVLARESNVRGFALNGVTYYYQLLGEPGFDPLSRGIVSSSQVEIVYREQGPGRTLIVYTIAAP